MKRISIKGVLIGGITDILSSTILYIPFVMYVSATVHASSLPRNQIGGSIAAAIHQNIFLFGLQLLLGFSCTTLGGYVAARIAKHDELLNGALASVLCVSIGLYSTIKGAGNESLTFHLFTLAITPLCALFGGYLRLMQARSKITSNSKN